MIIAKVLIKFLVLRKHDVLLKTFTPLAEKSPLTTFSIWC